MKNFSSVKLHSFQLILLDEMLSVQAVWIRSGHPKQQRICVGNEEARGG